MCDCRPQGRDTTRRLLAARDGLECFYCRRPFTCIHEPTIDHVIPVITFHHLGCKTQRNMDHRNEVLACRACNNDKGCSVPPQLVPVLWGRLADLDPVAIMRGTRPVLAGAA